MITKGIVTFVKSSYEVQVRIPIINGFNSKNSTPNSELYYATVCCPPNMQYDLQPNDVVFIAFEDNDYAKPIIIGTLNHETSNFRDASLNVANLNVKYNSNLSKNTTVNGINLYDVVKKYSEGQFPGGQALVFSAENNGVALPSETSKLTNFTQDDYNAVFNALASDAMSR